MPTWKVVNRITGEVVHAYGSDEPVEWNGMEFSTHDHVEYVEPVVSQDGSICMPLQRVKLALSTFHLCRR